MAGAENVIEQAAVQISPSFYGFQAEYRRKLGNITPKKLSVPVVPDFTGFTTTYRAKLKALTPKSVKVKIEFEGSKKAIASLNAMARAIEAVTNAQKLRRDMAKDVADEEKKNRKAIRDAEDLADKLSNVKKQYKDFSHLADATHRKLLQTDAVYRRSIARRGTFGGDRVAELRNELFAVEQLGAATKRAFDEQDREVKRRDRDRDARRRRLLTRPGRGGRGGGVLAGIPEMGTGLLDFGRKGVQPMNLLIGAAVALSPALISLASSAAFASTSLVALAPAALGAATAFVTLGVAFKGPIEAFKLLDQVEKGSDAALEELQARLGKMSDAGRTFFGQLVNMRKGFQSFQRQVESATLPGFTSALMSIQERGKDGVSVMGLFKQSIIGIGATISRTTAQMGAMAATPMFKSALATVIKNNQTAFDSLGRASVAVMEPLTRIFAGASPLVARFGTYVEQLAGKFSDWVSTFKDSDIAGFFQRAGDELAKWWTIATNLGGALYNIMAASLPSGQTLVDRLVAFTAAVKDWTASSEGVNKLQQVFTFFANLDYVGIASGITTVVAALYAYRTAALVAGAATAAATAIGTGGASLIIPAIIAGIGALGASAAVAYAKIQPFRDIVNQLIATLGRMWKVIMEKVKPAFDAAFAKIGETLAKHRPQIEAFLGTLESLAPIIGENIASAATMLGDVVSGLIDLFFSLGKAIAPVARIALIVFREVTKIVTGALGLIRDAVIKVVELAKSAYDKIPGFLKPNIDFSGLITAMKGVDKFLDRMGEGLGEGVDAVIRGIEDGMKRVQMPAIKKPKVEEADEKKKPGEKAKPKAPTAKPGAAVIPRTGGAGEDLQQAKDKARSARDAVVDAYTAIRKTQREQIQAQQELSKAREDAAKHLRELRLQVQGLAADEEAARLKLAIAQEKLKSFEYTSAIDPLVRRGLRNEVSQAESDLNEQMGKGNELRRELVTAERLGIEHAPEVLRAKERLIDLTEEQARNNRDLRKAQDDASLSAKGLQTAQNNLSLAVSGTSTAYKNLKTDIGKVPKKAQTDYTVVPKIAVPGLEDKLAHIEFKYNAKPKAPFVGPVAKPGTPTQPGLADLFKPPVTNPYATGGPVVGPGTSTQDKVHAMLSPGEYVTPTKAAQYYGKRAMTMIKDRVIPRSVFEHYGYDDGYAAGGYVWPAPGHHGISAGFNQYRQNFMGKTYYHKGTDIPAPTGAPIVAAAPGRVIQSGWYGGGGNTVSIASAGGLVLRYMHMLRTLASVNQIVAAGQKIGLVDSTGRSTGPHLHFQAERPGGKGNEFNAMSLMGKAVDIGAVPGAVTPGVAGTVTMTPTLTEAGARLIAGVAGIQTAVRFGVGAVNALGAGIAMPEPVTTLAIPTALMDEGGILPPGPTLTLNRTGRAERLTNTTGGRPMRLDKRDLQLLAAMLSHANAQRPVEMDGVRVAKQVATQQYVPLGV